MKTALDIFQITMALTDNVDDEGNFDTEDTKEYKDRTLALLNSFFGELYPYSNTFIKADEEGKRAIMQDVLSFDTDVGLDDYIARDLAPYKLGALLMLDENQSLAQTLENIYLERLRKLQEGKDKAVIIGSGGNGDPLVGASPRAMVNGGIGGYGRTHGFTRWM